MKNHILKNIDVCELAVRQVLKELLSKIDIIDIAKDIKLATCYSVLAKSKKIRSYLLIETAKMFGGNYQNALYGAAVIELIHTYSLIHDDLPSMDNDDYRRGQKSCHKEFDEATALLAGNAILTYAFELLTTDILELDDKTKLKLLNVISSSCGFSGMVAGQMADLFSAKNQISFDDFIKIQELKTGKLFTASCLFGAIISQSTEDEIKLLHNYSMNIGISFQIIDDIIDNEAKPSSILYYLNHNESYKLAKDYTNTALESLGRLSGRDINSLFDLALFLLERSD